MLGISLFTHASACSSVGWDTWPRPSTLVQVWSLPHDDLSWTPGLESLAGGGGGGGVVHNSGVACGPSFFTRPTATRENYSSSLPKPSTTEKDTCASACTRGVCRGLSGPAIPDLGQTFLQHGHPATHCSLHK